MRRHVDGVVKERMHLRYYMKKSERFSLLPGDELKMAKDFETACTW